MIHFEHRLMPYNVMCVCVFVHMCECGVVVVVVLWCARIKPTRSKNTYVQAGIQSCLLRCVKNPTSRRNLKRF